MANDNETVAELHEWAHRESNRLYSYNYNRAPEMQEWWEDADIDDFADRALAAHKRELAEKDAEIAELRECLKEAVEWSCGNPDEACEDCVAHGGDTPCKCEKWRKALEGAIE